VKKFKVIAALFACLLMIVTAVPGFAASSKTYTYSIDGTALASPDAYTAEKIVDSKSIGLEVQLDTPSDIETDDDGNVYIADPKNNRIVILDNYYNYQFEISQFVNNMGVDDSLNGAKGVFIWEGVISDGLGNYVNEKYIFVADTENARIVKFDREGNYITHYEAPESDVFEEDSIYKPISIAVDTSLRMYVVSSTTYEGVISLNNDGTFSGFIGAQKVAYSIIDIIWRRFQTAEQRALTKTYIPTEYNNITIDEDGFVYVTSSSIDENNLTAAIRDKSSQYQPVKKLNTAGTDIMRRNSFFSPVGEVEWKIGATVDVFGPSSIVDVALGPQGTWTIIDQKRSRMFTYDENGSLLFAFGDQGTQLGNLQRVAGIVYQGEKMLVLDSETGSFTIFKRTEYGDLLITAIKNNNERKYSLSITDWENILQRNNNFDAAYIGLGKAYYRQGQWEKSMDYYKVAYDTADYSDSFKMWRKDLIEDIIWVIPIVVVALCVGVYLFFRYAGKVNAATAISGKKRTFGQEILYAFHLMFHPFDGFWDLKHEKRGSLRGAIFWVVMAIIAFTYQAIGRSFLYNPRGSYISIIGQLTGLLVPLFLFVTANWCLTTLMDGEGSFKDVFIACSYAISPLPMLIILGTILTHFVTTEEQGFVSLILGVAYVWVGLLLYFGVMVTHDYSIGKNTITIVGSIVGMMIIMFVLILFSGLLIKMVAFVSNIWTEISFRL